MLYSPRHIIAYIYEFPPPYCINIHTQPVQNRVYGRRKEEGRAHANSGARRNTLCINYLSPTTTYRTPSGHANATRKSPSDNTGKPTSQYETGHTAARKGPFGGAIRYGRSRNTGQKAGGDHVFRSRGHKRTPADTCKAILFCQDFLLYILHIHAFQDTWAGRNHLCQ